MHKLLLSAGVAVLAGCAQVMAPPSFFSPLSADQATPARGELLYVAHSDSGVSHQDAGVSIFTFPQGKPFAKIDLRGYPWGVCSDRSGNVWVAYAHHRFSFIAKFPHGATTPIKILRLPNGALGFGCAVDPSSGDLAVMIGSSVEIWPGARDTKPIMYASPFVAQNGAYDDAGNLFIDGIPGGSDTWLLFGELAKGKGKVLTVTLDKRGTNAGGVQWDGKYVAIASGVYHGHVSRIFRVSVSRLQGTVVSAVRMDNMSRASPIFLDGHDVLGTHELLVVGGRELAARIESWSYPAGGDSTPLTAKIRYVTGVAISK
jgi:hypothetical protein